MAKISGHEYPLSKIFSPEFHFVIPAYQRPYAWTTEQAGELFDDIHSFCQQQGGRGADDPYLVGVGQECPTYLLGVGECPIAWRRTGMSNLLGWVRFPSVTATCKPAVSPVAGMLGGRGR